MTQRSSDIVERLREEPGQYSTLFVKAMFKEAADEIEQLRLMLQDYERVYGYEDKPK